MTALSCSPGRDSLDFPRRFEAKFGRRLRILHIGNIANYAFVNAKMQRQAGIDADCIDPNFYHIMACPEWLEAPITGDHGDDFRPKWSRVSLNGYKRPAWFVQGDEELAFRYLVARNAGRGDESWAILRQLEIHRRAFTNDTPLPEGLLAALLKSEHPILRRLRQSANAILRRGRPIALPPLAGVVPSAPAHAVAPPLEVIPYIDRAHLFRDALAHYDLIQGYTVQAVYPAAAGLPNFLSYELGTIRGLPFEDSAMGRLTRWVYLMSPEVFVTNTDCMPSAERLGLDMEHVHRALHAFDVEDAIAFSRRWHEMPGDDVPVFYAPARQHWKHGNDSILKGNDVAIRAAALLKARGRSFQLILGEWGSEVDLSKALIEDLEVGDCIGWSKPLPRNSLWPAFMRARAIIDQFKSPAFGGVSLEALALGKRLITGYDHAAGSAYFSEAPPILECRTPESVATAMETCLDDPDDRTGLGRKAQDWMMHEHGLDRQLSDQYRVYEQLLSRLSYDRGRWKTSTPC